MTHDEANRFHSIARALACAFDTEADARARFEDARTALTAAADARISLQDQLEPCVSTDDRRALFTFDGKTAITVVWRAIDVDRGEVAFFYDRRILRGL